MYRKQFLLALVFVALFSFLGGIVGGAISGGRIILAAKEFVDNSTMESPKKIKYLESETIISKAINADAIFTKSVYIVNEDGKIIGGFFENKSGNPMLALYSREKPFLLWEGGNVKSAVAISVENSEPQIQFRDKDFENRIVIRIDKYEPQMLFQYRKKLRLALGTNMAVSKNTGDQTKFKGSVCTYDNKGNVTSKMP